MASEYLHFLVGVVAAGADEPTRVAEIFGFCIGTVLTGDLTLGFSYDFMNVNEAIDEEHSSKRTGIISRYGDSTAALGTLHFLVPLLYQKQLLDAPSAVDVEAGQGLRVVKGIQTDGTLQLFL